MKVNFPSIRKKFFIKEDTVRFSRLTVNFREPPLRHKLPDIISTLFCVMFHVRSLIRPTQPDLRSAFMISLITNVMNWWRQVSDQNKQATKPSAHNLHACLLRDLNANSYFTHLSKSFVLGGRKSSRVQPTNQILFCDNCN